MTEKNKPRVSGLVDSQTQLRLCANCTNLLASVRASLARTGDLIIVAIRDSRQQKPQQAVSSAVALIPSDQCFPTFLGLRHPTEKNNNLRHP